MGCREVSAPFVLPGRLLEHVPGCLWPSPGSVAARQWPWSLGALCGHSLSALATSAVAAGLV